jgi:hypothetical protein
MPSNDYDPYVDLVNANRDELLRKHQEAVSLLRRVLTRPDLDPKRAVEQARDVLDALNLFHPMHCDWKGWPKVDD